MIHTDSNGSSSDVPKRSKKFFNSISKNIGKKQIIYIILPLLLINVGLVHSVVGQLNIKASAISPNQVKDETTSLPSAGEVTSDQVEENTIVAEESFDPIITTYIVKDGDTLSGIAAKFNISINTVRWANDLTQKTSKISIGDELVILPVTGVKYVVKKGDTLSGIAVKFDANQEDILKFNDIEADAIKVGLELIIPGAEPIVVKAPVVKVAAKTKTTTTTSPKEKIVPPVANTRNDVIEKEEASTDTSASHTSVYINPIPGAILTQGIHDGNAVDFGAKIGTTVYAAAAGNVIIAKSSGYNGGYGQYIVITHPAGSQTLYGHLSDINVSVGDTVTQGQVIGLSGNSGLSTGPHLHFKILNGPKNPFATFKKGTKF